MTSRRNLVRFIMAALLCMSVQPENARAEVVDRTIAVVNHHLVTWSDLDEQMRFEALENRRPLKDLNDADRRASFDHLVQDRTLRDQMQGITPAEDSEVDSRISELREDWKMAHDDVRWAATLDLYGLSQTELRQLVANQIEILRFTEFRIRPLVRVSREEAQEYYTNTLAPQVRAQGQNPEPFETVLPKIRELLSEQKMNREVENWLKSLRAQSSIQLLWDGVR